MTQRALAPRGQHGKGASCRDLLDDVAASCCQSDADETATNAAVPAVVRAEPTLEDGGASRALRDNLWRASDQSRDISLAIIATALGPCLTDLRVLASCPLRLTPPAAQAARVRGPCKAIEICTWPSCPFRDLDPLCRTRTS